MNAQKLLLTLLLTLAYFSGRSQRITLPIEVLSATTAVKQVQLPVRLPETGALLLQIHGLKFEGQASIKINNSPWSELMDEAIVYPDDQYGGQGGGYHTLRFKIGLESFGTFDKNRGTQTIGFRYNGTDGNTIGFRVLGINIQNPSGTPLLGENDFVSVDPGSWRPPVAGQAAITAGKELWETATIVDRPGGNAIKAKCASCHATNGADLEYFAYSNTSIIERSQFHELTEEEGKMIASYIRSLGASENIERLGRPYNPPYQPGKSLEDKSVRYWAAGAGIEAVADDEAETIRAMFPNGTGTKEIQKVVDHNKQLDITKIPLAIQFPDWNEWLPKVHPIDIWKGSYFESSEAYSRYEALLQNMRNNSEAVLFDKDFDKNIRGFQEDFRTFIAEGRTDDRGSAWRAQGSTAIGQIKAKYLNNNSPEFAKEQLAKWLALRYWEMIKLNRLEDRAVEIRPGSEAWQWPMSAQAVHQVAPHIVADNQNNFEGQNPLVGDYRSTVWYQLQLTLNSGEGLDLDKTYIVHPVDWPYQMRHLWEAAERTPDKRWEGARTFLSLIKMYQSQSNTNGTSSKGWIMRFVHPKFLMRQPKGEKTTHESVNFYEPGLSGKLQNALLLEWLKVVAEFEEGDWSRQVPADVSEVSKWAKIEPIDAVPTTNIPRFNTNQLYSVAVMEHMNTLYRLLPIMEDTEGISCATVKQMAVWAQSIWPEGDWVERLKEKNCTDEDSAIAEPVLQFVLNVVGGTGSGSYPLGTEVVITADEMEGFRFYQWTTTDNTVAIADIFAPTTTVVVSDTAAPIEAVYVPDNGISVSVYPNPASETLSIITDTDQKAVRTFTMYQMDGKMVSSLVEPPGSNNAERTISVEGLPPGIYILRINTGLENLFEKVIVE